MEALYLEIFIKNHNILENGKRDLSLLIIKASILIKMLKTKKIILFLLKKNLFKNYGQDFK